MDAVVAHGQHAEHAGHAQLSHPPPALARCAPPLAEATWIRPLAFALAAMLALLAFYLGVITLAQGWAHAAEQLAADRWFVAAITTGFGTQIGLFTHLRGLHRQHAQRMAHLSGGAGVAGTAGAAGSVAASTGTSTAAMLACCAHHLTDVLAALGLSGAALFLNAYKTPLLWLGIAMNLAGVLFLLRHVRSAQGMSCHADSQSTGPAAPPRSTVWQPR